MKAKKSIKSITVRLKRRCDKRETPYQKKKNLQRKIQLQNKSTLDNKWAKILFLDSWSEYDKVGT